MFLYSKDTVLYVGTHRGASAHKPLYINALPNTDPYSVSSDGKTLTWEGDVYNKR